MCKDSMANRIKRAQVRYKTEQPPLPDYKRLYNNRRWKRLRKLYLDTHPFCVECKAQDEIKLATELDHIKPHRGNARLFWDQDNWQGLCRFHHGIKSAGERTVS